MDFSPLFCCRGKMIAKQFAGDWRWVKRTIIWLHRAPSANPTCSHDCKTVRIIHRRLTPASKPSIIIFAGHNLQICFMNEAASDSESSDSETCPKLSQGMSRKKNVQRSSSLMKHRNASLSNNPYNSRPLSVVKSVMDPVVKGKKNEKDKSGVRTYFVIDS